MKCLNKHCIMGYLGKDAETRYTPSAVAVTEFSVATTEKWKDDSGELQEKTNWHNCVLWRGDNVAEYLTKGTPVYLEGRSEQVSWEHEGKKYYKTQIVVDKRTLSLLPRSQGAKPPLDESGTPEARPPQGGVDDDDVPF